MWSIFRTSILTVLVVTVVGSSSVGEAKPYTFGSLLVRANIPGYCKKTKQTTKKVTFKCGKSGVIRLSRKFGKVSISAVAAGIKAGWRKSGWTITSEKRGRLAGTKHPAMVLKAKRKGIAIAVYVANWKNRIYTVMFADLAKRFSPKKYNKIMLGFAPL